MKSLLLLTIFLLSISHFNLKATYSLNKAIDSQEMRYVIDYLQKNDPKLLTKYASQINNWAVNMELTNLELVIKTEFYKSFLNDSKKQGDKVKNISDNQLRLISSKTSNDPESFSSWFIKKLLESYKESTPLQKSYMSPWLLTYLETNPSAWRKKIKSSIMNYLEHLKNHLQIAMFYGKNDRTAAIKLNNQSLIIWNPEPIKKTTPNKSKAIDLIDKNLPKAP